jgi:hypothetical protein
VAYPTVIVHERKQEPGSIFSLLEEKERTSRRRMTTMTTEQQQQLRRQEDSSSRATILRHGPSKTKTAGTTTTTTEPVATPTDIPTQDALAVTREERIKSNSPERENAVTPYLEISGDRTLEADLVFGCVRTGEVVVTVNLTFAPIFQPYRPTLFSMRKTCGGLRTDLHVYRSIKLLEDSNGTKTAKDDPRTRPPPPINVETGVPSAIVQDGVPTKEFRRLQLLFGGKIPPVSKSARKKKPYHVGGDERTTTFYVHVPIREIDESLGNTSVYKTPCRNDAGAMCRQLPLTNQSHPSVTATCDPPVCTSTYLGVGAAGPSVSGEIVGDTPTDLELEPWTSSGDVVPMYVTYGCKQHMEVIVTIKMQPSFYDPTYFSYRKLCSPSIWRIPSLALISLVALVVLSVAILCIPCPCFKGDTLLKKIRHGNGQYVAM